MRTSTILLALSSVSWLLAGSATAALINVTWSATVTRSGIAGTVDPGDTITGSYIYDDTAPIIIDVGPIYRLYNTNHVSSFSVNGLSGSRTVGRIGVFDNVSNFDQFDSRGTAGVYSGDRDEALPTVGTVSLDSTPGWCR